MKKYLVLACLCGLLCLTGCMKQDEKDFMLAQAVQKSNVKEVQKWLKKKANPNAHFDYFTNEGGKEEVTPLLLTMLTQNTEIAQLLIKAGANVNEQIGEKKAFALLLASGHHYNAQMVQLLLQAGANPNLTDYNGETPLMYASLIHENTEIIKLLLDAKADPNLRNNHDATALLIACGNQHPETVKLLLEAKADPNAMNEYNLNPLLAASAQNNYPIVKMLLQAGADPNERADPSWTKKENLKKLFASLERSKQQPVLSPLIYACLHGNAKMVALLLKANADPNITSSDLNSPLLFVASMAPQNHLKIAQMLLKKGADVNYYNFHQDQKTAYEFAAERQDTQLMAVLKKYGADTKTTGKQRAKHGQKLSISEAGGITIKN